MERPIAAFLQAGAGVMLYAAGLFGGDAVLLVAPALASGAAGLWLWGKAATARIAKHEQAPSLHAADRQAADVLLSVQEDVARLREDRSFFQQLYERSPARASIGPNEGPGSAGSAS